MEGLKCPLCAAISLTNSISDGEMFICPFCNHKFTVTSIRRYYLHNKRNEVNVDLHNLQDQLSKLNYSQICNLIKIALEELEHRQSYKLESIIEE